MSKRMTRAELERKLVELQEHHSHTWAKYNETIQGLGGKIQELNKAREQIARLEVTAAMVITRKSEILDRLMNHVEAGKDALGIITGHPYEYELMATPKERLAWVLIRQMETIHTEAQYI